jgi:hypothetical protein
LSIDEASKLSTKDNPTFTRLSMLDAASATRDNADRHACAVRIDPWKAERGSRN